MTLVEIVRRYSTEIENGRSLRSILNHMRGEVAELAEEVTLVESGKTEGVDGIIGENIDVILCALDMIFVHAPEITEEQIAAIARLKCEKWVRKYT